MNLTAPDAAPAAFRFAVKTSDGSAKPITARDLLRDVYAGKASADDYELVIVPADDSD
jgi:hypothetical protein